MYNDPISDMINKIVISYSINLEYIFVYYSKINFSILKVLKFEGYIVNFFLFNNEKFPKIYIRLKYYQNKPVISFFKRVSKLSRRVYKSYKNLPVFMNGLGTIILSTTRGIISDRFARKIGLGGEIICYVF